MARPGPTPRPAVVQELHGARKSRVRPEPVPLAQPLTMPDYLPVDARPLWDALAEQLAGLGIARAIDSEALGVYCVMLARFRAAAVEVPGDRRAVRQLAGEIRLWCREFGFTPSGRVGLRADIPAADPSRLLG